MSGQPTTNPILDAELDVEDSQFTKEQLIHINSYLPELTKEVQKHNPGFRGHCAALIEWKKATAASLMEEDLFKPLRSMMQKKSEEVIQRRYTNYINNTLKCQHLLQLVSSSSGSSTNDGVSSTISEIFAGNNLDALEAEKDIVRKEYPDLTGGPLHTKALKCLWDAADQDLWEKAAADLAKDISANQKEFPALIAKALHGLCTRERLGSTLMMFLYAFHDENDGIMSGIVYTGYNAKWKKEIAFELEDHGAYAASWEHHADILLPRKTVRMLHDEEGLPLFPDLDIMNGSASQLIQQLQEYFDALWEFSWPQDAKFSTIPWGNISSSPKIYYDTTIFTFPAPLIFPAMQSNPMVIFSITQYLQTICKTTPFRFREKTEIEALLVTQAQLAEAEGNTSDAFDTSNPAENQQSSSPVLPTMSQFPAEGLSMSLPALLPVSTLTPTLAPPSLPFIVSVSNPAENRQTQLPSASPDFPMTSPSLPEIPPLSPRASLPASPLLPMPAPPSPSSILSDSLSAIRPRGISQGRRGKGLQGSRCIPTDQEPGVRPMTREGVERSDGQQKSSRKRKAPEMVPSLVTNGAPQAKRKRKNGEAHFWTIVEGL
ncbi:hypothetical protein BDQ12DRAFT_726252 [Crucibulum laeve]|uniref:Uncharacterized protein n=1 Tax=Crucibulum laeve TaxID=68775 RepID=A0A5C3LQG8_9AGAR|nr:hypothetical protein BDQ12DRAFT_726252 [Crucibulum laeve]